MEREHMEDLNCGMCGERESKQVLARREDWEELWLVCDECAEAMLSQPALARMWQRVRELTPIAQRGYSWHQIERGAPAPQSFRTYRNTLGSGQEFGQT